MLSKDIVPGTPIADFAAKLYEETYDRRMYVPIRELEKVYTDNKADFVAVFDEDLFVGFYYVYRYNGLALVYYLAVSTNLRGRGYGTEILDLIIDRYGPEYRIV